MPSLHQNSITFHVGIFIILYWMIILSDALSCNKCTNPRKSCLNKSQYSQVDCPGSVNKCFKLDGRRSISENTIKGTTLNITGVQRGCATTEILLFFGDQAPSENGCRNVSRINVDKDSSNLYSAQSFEGTICACSSNNCNSGGIPKTTRASTPTIPRSTVPTTYSTETKTPTVSSTYSTETETSTSTVPSTYSTETLTVPSTYSTETETETSTLRVPSTYSTETPTISNETTVSNKPTRTVSTTNVSLNERTNSASANGIEFSANLLLGGLISVPTLLFLA